VKKYQTQLCQVTAIGGPAPIHPLALTEFLAGLEKFAEIGGFTSIGKGPAASGIISDIDEFESV